VIQDRVGAASDAWQHFVDEVDTVSGGSPNPIQRVAAGAQVADRQLSRRGQAMQFDADRRRVVWSPRVPSSALPAAALHEPRDTVHVPRLLTLGYTVQENDDATVSFWPAAPPPSTPPAASVDPQVAALERRLQLIDAGGLRSDRAQVQAALAAAQTAPPTGGQP
jgi:hypothetical protein